MPVLELLHPGVGIMQFLACGEKD